jgi:hypothetical protein
MTMKNDLQGSLSNSISTAIVSEKRPAQSAVARTTPIKKGPLAISTMKKESSQHLYISLRKQANNNCSSISRSN